MKRKIYVRKYAQNLSETSFPEKVTYTKDLTSMIPSSGSIKPFSVIIPPVMLHAGVTSKAGFQHLMSFGAFDVEINSSPERSSMGIEFPLGNVVSQLVKGAAT